MKHGFIKTAAVTPDIRVADVAYNTESICRKIDETTAAGAKSRYFRSFVLPDIPAGISLPRRCCFGMQENLCTGSQNIRRERTR